MSIRARTDAYAGAPVSTYSNTVNPTQQARLSEHAADFK
jgi:hypothetical protein